MLILKPVVFRSHLVKQEFHERCIIEENVCRSRKWLSSVSLLLKNKCKNRIELGQGMFQVL